MTPGAHAKGSVAALLVLAPLALALAAEPTTPTTQAPATGSVRRPAPHHRGQQGPEARLQLLVKRLKLDAAQEAKVRQALRAEREALRRLSSAPADPEVPRVTAIRAITSRTAERIRAVLNDDQRKLYGEPLPRDYATGQGQPSVESWLDAMRPKKGI